MALSKTDDCVFVGISDPVNIKDIMSDWGFQMGTTDSEAFLPTKIVEETEEAYIQRKTGISDDVLEELTAVTGDKSLGGDDMYHEQMDWLQEIPENNLKTSQFLKLKSRKKLKDKFNWSGMTRYPDSKLYNYFSSLPLPEELENRVEAPEVVLTVTMLRNFKFRQKKTSDNFFHKMRTDSSYNVLSTQYLHELRDRFQCQIDYVCPGDFSSDPNLPKDHHNRDLYPSGCFFIEETFYNDFRAVTSIDYSQNIIDWAKRKKMNDFKKADMTETRFIDLTIRLGQPYVYIHQGNCEHLFVFTDARLLHADDCFDRSRYPVVVNHLRPVRIPCRACNTFTAAWMTSDSPRDPDDPCFYCDKCLLMYHYDKDGKKIGEFVLYHYVDRILEEK